MRLGWEDLGLSQNRGHRSFFSERKTVTCLPPRSTIVTTSDTGSHHLKRRCRQRHAILVLANGIFSACASLKAALSGSPLRVVGDFPLPES